MTLRHLLCCAVLATLLSGCSSGGGPSVSDTPASEDSPATTDAQPTVPDVPDPVPVTATCTLTRTNLGTTTGYGLNIDRVATGLEECSFEGLFDGNTTWAQAALVEATWSRQPSQTGADLWIESDACPPGIPPSCTPPRTMGASSPLSIELSAQELRAIEGQEATVMAAGQGVVKDLEFTFYVTLFPGHVQPGFTAIP